MCENFRGLNFVDEVKSAKTSKISPLEINPLYGNYAHTTHANMHKHTCTQIHTHIHTHAHTCTHTHIHTHRHIVQNKVMFSQHRRS